ncbi:MAG: hypothetical protein ACKO81_14120 [Planctomycetota bacterium]
MSVRLDSPVVFPIRHVTPDMTSVEPRRSGGALKLTLAFFGLLALLVYSGWAAANGHSLSREFSRLTWTLFPRTSNTAALSTSLAATETSDSGDATRSPFQLPSYTRKLPERVNVAAVVLNAENRPDSWQEDQKANPATNSESKFKSASDPKAVPLLTPKQAEQVFDPPQHQPLLPRSLQSQPTRVQVPVFYLPIDPSSVSTTQPEPQAGQAEQQASAGSQAYNPEADVVQDAVNTAPARPNSETPEIAPLVPLDHPDWAGAHPELLKEELSKESSEGQLAPSDEITPLPLEKPSTSVATPLEPRPLEPRPVVATPASTEKSSSNSEVSDTTREKSAPTPPVAPWPKPAFLLERVSGVTFIAGMETWTRRTSELLDELHTLPNLADPRVVTILGELEQQTAVLEPLVIRFSNVPTNNADEALGPESLELRRLAYKLRQQIDVWYATHELAVRNISSFGDVDQGTVVSGLLVCRQRLSLPGVNPEWQRYLVLDQLDTAFNSLQSSPQEKRAAARRFLARLHSPILTDEQRDFLPKQVAPEMVEQLKVAAREEVRLEALLTEVEALQENRNGVAQHRVNQMFQNLAWHDDPAARELAATLDTHFRNSNFRVSVSAEMLNLLLPDTGEVQEPVNENVFGAEVRGQSRVANRLQIRLIPDTSRIQMRLEAMGKVFSQTEAQRSGFTIQNVGDARFQVFKRLAIGRDGITADQPEAWSRSTSKMVGMQSELDGVPVLGWVARRVAERKIAEQSPQVENYTRKRLESAIKQKFNTEIEKQLSEMQGYLYSNMIEPLTALELEPTPLEMRSTDSRVIMRYRLAGFDQMGGNTARPRGLQNSLLSMQIHETALNNLLNRIELNGNEYTAAELTAHLANVFGWQSTDTAQSRDATFEFAPFDPIRVTFAHGSAAVQLNLKRLRIGNGKTWKNLTATCNFIPQAEGGKILFVQDGSGVELTGHRLNLRDQVAVRAIFTALFKDQYELPILPKNIAQKLGPSATITQLELNDGWIGLSVDKTENLTPQRVTELEAPKQRGRKPN